MLLKLDEFRREIKKSQQYTPSPSQTLDRRYNRVFDLWVAPYQEHIVFDDSHNGLHITNSIRSHTYRFIMSGIHY